MKKIPFLTVMVIPHTDEKPKSIKIPAYLLWGLSILVIVSLTSGSLWTYNYAFMKTENNYLFFDNQEKNSIINDFSDNYFTLYQDVEELKREVVNVQNLEEEVRALNEFDPTISYFSVENQNLLSIINDITEKNKITVSSINDTKNTVETLETAIPSKEETLTDLVNLLEDRNETELSTPSIIPTYGRFSSRFGYRSDPMNGSVAFHTGLDIANTYGSPLYATADGIVTMACYKTNGYGNQILINHGNGYETFYGHNSKLVVEVGDYVKKGQLIGYIGSTGRSTGPHVHYEVRVYGEKVNPVNYIN